MWPRAGLLIVKGTGHGSILGDGLGWMTSPGDMLPFTMAAGYPFEGVGDGCRDRRKCVQCTRPLSLFSWAVAADSAAIWDGSRWALAKCTCHRIRVSRGYVDRVNVSNTTVNTVTVTNVYNTTIVNKTTNITNVTYVNRNVSGAVTAVPQRAFSSGQPVARAAVTVNARDIASAPVNARATVAPTSNSVLGVHAGTANHVAAPPAAVASRAVVAKAKAPPPPVPFAARQQALAAHPGQPIARQEMARMQPARATAAAPRPTVKQAPPGKPATATIAKPGSQPGNRPGNTPAANERPGANPAQPNRPGANNQPAPNNRDSDAGARPAEQESGGAARTERPYACRAAQQSAGTDSGPAESSGRAARAE